MEIEIELTIRLSIPANIFYFICINLTDCQ